MKETRQLQAEMVENDRKAAEAELSRETERREAEEKAENDRRELEEKAAAERRKELLNLATVFEADVGSVVDQISGAAGEMQSAAKTVSATAEETSSQSATVAAASEEASTNAQTVASATEELSASIQEITRQVSESAKVTRSAVSESEVANTKVTGSGRGRDEDRRGCRADLRHRQPDEPSGPQRNDRSGARRRGRQGICRGRHRGDNLSPIRRKGNR